ncbi:uncharacterized protein LOC122921131 [Bufo gargarizans]|uniref:uncharacterized protein LOC122921131 n=1 Tax=Bufo gargarizans TaxID=30331 RepID=UPI001CF37ADA|nr:uncharacterized protein LOC122921131 [Bufo gargarizans]
MRRLMSSRKSHKKTKHRVCAGCRLPLPDDLHDDICDICAEKLRTPDPQPARSKLCITCLQPLSPEATSNICLDCTPQDPLAEEAKNFFSWFRENMQNLASTSGSKKERSHHHHHHSDDMSQSSAIVSQSDLSSDSDSGSEEFFLLKKDSAEKLIRRVKRCLETNDEEDLFILFSGPRKGMKASKDTLGRWIKTTISESYILDGKEPPRPLRAHSTRATSTSWAERQQVDLLDICNAASWTSSSTFVHHYRLSNGPENSAFSTAVLSAVKQSFPPL